MNAIVTGSFDPITLGHIEIIKKASTFFEKLYVVALINKDKEYTFTMEQKKELEISVSVAKLNERREQLKKLAEHGSTMVLFLSSSLLEKAQQELIEGGYSPDTPAAIVYKATWPDEKVMRCTVSTLAETARKNHVTKTALITVGGFLGGEYDRSLLYDPGFSHGCREASR